jgi:DNA-binding response OmpR family regulator
MIKTDDISAQQDENRLAFLRYLAKRVVAVEQRIQCYVADGWNARGIAVLNDDVLRLVSACTRYDLLEASQNLLMLAQAFGGHITRGSLPDQRQSERMLALMAAINASLAALSDSPAHLAETDARQESSLEGGLRDAPAAAAMPPSIAAETAPAVAASGKSMPANTGASATRRIYCLSDGNALTHELGQRLQAHGFEIESVETIDELSELLTCMSPQVLLVDASHLSDLTPAGTARRDAQQRSQHQERIQMVAMAEQDSLQLRLTARRAGVDVLLFPPFNVADVAQKLQTLLTPAAEEKVRVLIVEDDHAQAMFAQSVLTNAGMQAQVEHDALHVLDSLRSLQPDLVLMDLHMPETNGMELTALIREHPAFMHTPIVFLSGETDPEARAAALSAGGDDFLSKPIRPKHLIAAVQNYARSVRAVGKPGSIPRAGDELARP